MASTARTCLELRNDAHNNSIGNSEASGESGGAVTGAKGIMLFGVRVMEGSFRKSVSMNNLAQYEQPHDSNADVAAGYASDDIVHPSARSRERKRGSNIHRSNISSMSNSYFACLINAIAYLSACARHVFVKIFKLLIDRLVCCDFCNKGVPWTEEEHKLFLLGLQKVGKGDWRGISRNFVKTRTPTQVASHAQKYFLRRNNHNRRRRRSSLFDITTDTQFKDSSMEDHQLHQKAVSHSPLQPLHQKNKGFPVSVFPAILPVTGGNSIENLTLGQSNQVKNSPNLIRPVPVLPVPPSSKMADLNLNHTTPTDSMPLSLKLSAPSPSSSSDQQSPAARRTSGFQGMSASFNSGSGESIISVA